MFPSQSNYIIIRFSVFSETKDRVTRKMASCTFCKIDPKEQLKSCVCKKASYCSKECQAKDWKVHKPSCPPFIIRESPGKGRGLFATRKIKEGQIILEEYPLITISDGMSSSQFEAKYYPNIDDETKAKILQLYDPAENIKTLDTDTMEKLGSKSPLMMLYKEARTDEIIKIFRIISGNHLKICGEKDLYKKFTETGLYNNISRINHSCVPNATRSWVMGDFQRKQVRALIDIEKDVEILVSSQNKEEFVFGSREFRRQELLETFGFLCLCSECSLEGEELEENERMRAEIREKEGEVQLLLTSEGSDPVSRKSVKKAMKLTQQRTNLVQKLKIRSEIVPAMIGSYHAAIHARKLGISPRENDPDIFKQEALKYAKMFGDNHIHLCNKYVNF